MWMQMGTASATTTPFAGSPGCELAAAHQAGLSYGKYRVFLEARALDPSLTPQDVKDMSMRQIRDLIQSLSEAGEEEAAAPQGQGRGGRGQRNRRQEKRGSP